MDSEPWSNRRTIACLRLANSRERTLSLARDSRRLTLGFGKELIARRCAIAALLRTPSNPTTRSHRHFAGRIRLATGRPRLSQLLNTAAFFSRNSRCIPLVDRKHALLVLHRRRLPLSDPPDLDDTTALLVKANDVKYTCRVTLGRRSHSRRSYDANGRRFCPSRLCSPWWRFAPPRSKGQPLILGLKVGILLAWCSRSAAANRQA